MTLSATLLTDVNTIFTVTRQATAGMETSYDITYNAGTVDTSAIGTNTISYTLSFVDHPDAITFTGSFTFILRCPVIVADHSIINLFLDDGSAGTAISNQPSWF